MMRFFAKIKELYQRMTDAISEWFLGDIYYYDVPTYPSDSKDTYTERKPPLKEEEYVDEPVRAKDLEGEDGVNQSKMICVVCEECHEKDRDIIKCDKPIDKHAVSVTRMECDVCGKDSRRLVYCRNYIKAFGKKSFLQENK